jgi:hypothetical protein
MHCVCVRVCVCVCVVFHLARNILQCMTGRHDYIGGCVTAITTLKNDILQKLLVAHLVKKSSTFDGL